MSFLVNIMIFILLIGGSLNPTLAFVPGQVLVKFKPGTAGSDALVIMGRSGLFLPQSFEPVTQELEAGTNLPLNALQMNSGDWLLLSVDSSRLAQRILSRLRNLPRVKSAGLTESESRSGPAGSDKIWFELTPYGSASIPSSTNRLAWWLSQELQVPVKVEAHDEQRFLLEVDYHELTLMAVERLKAITVVETAQPNFILGIRPAS